MDNLIKINNQNLQVKEFNRQRVVTFKDIDVLHERPTGTAKRNFNKNKYNSDETERFVKNVDYFELDQPDEIRTLGVTRPQGGTPSKIVLVTESGYLMLVKSFQDDLAWKVQRELVNRYFKCKEIKKQFQIVGSKQQLVEARLRNAKARQANILLKIANNFSLNDNYKQVLFSYASSIIADKPLIPLPEAEEKTYSAGEIGEMLGISSNKVGRLANEHNLKTKKYGKLFHDKSKYSNKEVETFRYYESIIPMLRKILQE